jgi:glutathione S-transferase
MNCGLRIQLHEHSAPLLRDLARLDELVTEGLHKFGSPFLAGAQFTAADAFYAPVAFRLQSYGLSLSQEVNAYFARLLQLPAMQDWYQQALAEPWLDKAHDALIPEVGTITADLRTGVQAV